MGARLSPSVLTRFEPPTNRAAGSLKPVRLLVVEDNVQTIERFCSAMHADPRVELVGCVRTVREAMRAIDKTEFDIALVDLGLPDGSGLDVIRRISQLDRGVESVVVTMFGEEQTVLQAIEAGACGYLVKGQIGSALLDAVLEVRSGGSPISPVIARQLLKRLRPQEASGPAAAESQLSARELGILRLVTQGFTVAEIANKLCLSPHTVSSHVKNMYKKLHVCTRGQAIHEAYRRHLI